MRTGGLLPPKDELGLSTATGDPGKEERRATGIPVVAAFDGYRAWAIAGIVLLHVLISSGVIPRTEANWFSQLAEGTLGQLVDVLFIISGFVVFLPTAARRGELGDIRAYAIRRAARLVPAYWVMIAIIVLLTNAVAVEPRIAPPGVGSVAIHALFLHVPAALFEPFAMGFGVDQPVWTLSLEVTFYALLPLIAGRYFRRPLLGLALAAAVTALWHEAIMHLTAIASFLGVQASPQSELRTVVNALYQFPFFAFSFALGMTGAWAYVGLRRHHASSLLARRVARVQLASLMALAVCAYVVARNSAHGGPVLQAELARLSPPLALGYSASLATLMVATTLGAARWQQPFCNRLARWLGDVSYGIYLVHLVIIAYAVRVLSLDTGGGILAFAVLAALVAPFSVLYGYASARFVEQPIRRWAHRFGRRSDEPTLRAPIGPTALRSADLESLPRLLT